MSQQLQLVQFPHDEEGRLYESESPEILSIGVDSELSDLLRDEGLLETFKLYEDSTFQAYSEALRLKGDQIDNALRAITARLLQVLESEQVAGLATIHSEPEITNLMSALQSISGAYQVIKLKRDNFASLSSTIVVLSA